MGTTPVVSIFYSMPPLYTKSYDPRLLDIMNTKEIEKAINHITTLQVRLCHSENNLQYIKRLQALRHWLNTLDTLLDKQGKSQGEYAAAYKSYFQPCCGFSFYDRVYHSILAYQYGDKPF